jgi:hypothetical protein
VVRTEIGCEVDRTSSFPVAGYDFSGVVISRPASSISYDTGLNSNQC